MCEKRKNGAECIKYEDLMSECRRTKSLLKGIMIAFQTKGPQTRRIPHGSFRLSQRKSSGKKKKHAGCQNLSKDINKL